MALDLPFAHRLSRFGYFYNIGIRCCSRLVPVAKQDSTPLDVIAAAAVAGRSAETVRRWVWSGRLKAHKRGNKLLIERSDLDRLLKSSTRQNPLTLAQWLDSVKRSGLKSRARAESAADLVLADRRARSRDL